MDVSDLSSTKWNWEYVSWLEWKVVNIQWYSMHSFFKFKCDRTSRTYLSSQITPLWNLNTPQDMSLIGMNNWIGKWLTKITFIWCYLINPLSRLMVSKYSILLSSGQIENCLQNISESDDIHRFVAFIHHIDSVHFLFHHLFDDIHQLGIQSTSHKRNSIHIYLWKNEKIKSKDCTLSK